MAFQYVPQGTLNRLQSSFIVTAFPALNVTPPFLAKAGIRLGFEGQGTLNIDTMTGLVTSPEPFIKVRAIIALTKTLLGPAYKAQWEQATLLGDTTVRGDTPALQPYSLSNCSIMSVNELNFDGTDPSYVVTIEGAYYINQSLWP